MVTADQIGQVSLGLVGVCYLLWSTLPWAYLKDLESDAAKDAKSCLINSTNEFLISGLLFFASLIAWMGTSITENVAPVQAIALLGGSVVFVLAAWDAKSVVAYRYDSKVKVKPLIHTRDPVSLAYLSALSGLVVNLALWFYTLPLHVSWTDIHISGKILFTTSFVGWVAAVILVLPREIKWVSKWHIGQILNLLVALPWLFWLAYAVAKAFGFW